jgi:hypothetical protein
MRLYCTTSLVLVFSSLCLKTVRSHVQEAAHQLPPPGGCLHNCVYLRTTPLACTSLAMAALLVSGCHTATASLAFWHAMAYDGIGGHWQDYVLTLGL